MKMKDGLTLGFILGAITALLCAPKSGKELRKELKGKVNIVPKNFYTLMESVVDLSASVLDFAKDSFKEQSERFSEAVHKGLDVAKEKSDELKKLASTIASR